MNLRYNLIKNKKTRVILPVRAWEPSPLTIYKSDGLKLVVPAKYIDIHGNIIDNKLVELLRVASKGNTALNELSSYGVTYEVV